MGTKDDKQIADKIQTAKIAVLLALNNLVAILPKDYKEDASNKQIKIISRCIEKLSNPKESINAGIIASLKSALNDLKPQKNITKQIKNDIETHKNNAIKATESLYNIIDPIEEKQVTDAILKEINNLNEKTSKLIPTDKLHQGKKTASPLQNEDPEAIKIIHNISQLQESAANVIKSNFSRMAKTAFGYRFRNPAEKLLLATIDSDIAFKLAVEIKYFLDAIDNIPNIHYQVGMKDKIGELIKKNDSLLKQAADKKFDNLQSKLNTLKAPISSEAEDSLQSDFDLLTPILIMGLRDEEFYKEVQKLQYDLHNKSARTLLAKGASSSQSKQEVQAASPKPQASIDNKKTEAPLKPMPAQKPSISEKETTKPLTFTQELIELIQSECVNKLFELEKSLTEKDEERKQKAAISDTKKDIDKIVLILKRNAKKETANEISKKQANNDTEVLARVTLNYLDKLSRKSIFGVTLKDHLRDLWRFMKYMVETLIHKLYKPTATVSYESHVSKKKVELGSKFQVHFFSIKDKISKKLLAEVNKTLKSNQKKRN